MDAEHFEEIQVLGSNFMVYQFKAKILPDRHFIQDMVDLSGGGWEEISAEAYRKFHDKCVQEYKRMK